jgi:hypothetical protein
MWLLSTNDVGVISKRNFLIRQRKTGNVLELPLTNEAANVLIDYLRQVPRPTGYRNLFFRVLAPAGGITPMTVKSAFRARSTQPGFRHSPLQGRELQQHAAIYTESNKSSGCFSAIASNFNAASLGVRRPASQA